ncbi:hypothetical protein LCGC14_0132230 [marine sediment metagenome]|uniref:Glycosyltransferase 2-like domain-containing protein n=1 Tax=marine sediment metagenome TaxID=412755 RepID=A0A0F9VJ30_9ZZZZ|nr:glycosyltransferase [Maribacter sp.]HDZ03959.1 glycosyltransferase [Maribacter sp.]HEC39459.1 glycosyltransferase [bacterium]
MKFSIIIPLYNKEKYIERCLESLLCQGLKPDEYEVIIVDDGSKDSGALVVKNYAKKNTFVNIKLIIQKNQGPSAARNNGLIKAIGEYIYFLDADDYLAPNALECLFNLSQQNNIELLEFDSEYINEGAQPNFSKLDTENLALQVTDGKDYIAKYGLRNSACFYVIKRRFLLDSNITFLEDMRAYEDMIFTSSVFLKASSVSKVNLDAHRYVKVAGSIVTSKDSKKNLEFIQGMVKAVVEFNDLIKNYKSSTNDTTKVINRLKDKQQAVVFALIIRAYKYRLDPKVFNTILNKMKTLEVYPITLNMDGTNNYIRLFMNNKNCVLLGLKVMRILKFL